MTPTKTLEAAQKQARDELWRRGKLLFKLKPKQKKWYKLIKTSKLNVFYTEMARKGLGKTFMHCIIALEVAIQNPGARINFVALTGQACWDTIMPILTEISEDAPEDIKGAWSEQASRWELPNGAYLSIFGGDTPERMTRARGPKAVMSVIDEGGFQPHLDDLINSILLPQMILQKRDGFLGMCLVVSSTSETPGHDFITNADLAGIHGSHIKADIYESEILDPIQIESMIENNAMGKGLTREQYVKSTAFAREYMCERVVDETKVVYPEFSGVRTEVVKVWPEPVGFEEYVYKVVSIDPGMSDASGILFGYVDFTAAKIIIQAEMLLQIPPNTADLAKKILTTEERLWGPAFKGRIQRVIDDSQGRTVMDLQQLSGLPIARATKNDRNASIGMVRSLIASKRIIIDPSCVNLQKQLLNATRTKNGKDFTRNQDGHFDLCAALNYLVRTAPLLQNPYPPHFDILTGRKMDNTHPIARRQALGEGVHKSALAEGLFAGNSFGKKLLGMKPKKF